MKNLSGACLCGQVSYQIHAELKRFYFCHCQQCRKLTGGAHAANILAQPAKINWVRGKNKIKRYDAPDGRAFTHVFCTDCGAGLPFLNITSTTLFIPVGSLDTPPGIEVNANIFWAEAPDWYEAGLKAKRTPGFFD